MTHLIMAPAQIAVVVSDFERMAADLDLVRSLGGIAPRRTESLRQAADLLRSMASGEFARTIAAILISQGAVMTPPPAQEPRQ